jgi:hypothetical protein
LARDYQGSLFRGGWGGLWPQLAEAGRLLVRQFGWPGVVISFVGCGVVWRRDLRVAGVLLLGMVAQFLFALNYYVPNTYVYYLPVYVWLVVCAAAGVDAALGTSKAVATSEETPVRGNGFSRLGPHLTLACILLAAAWVVHLADSRWVGMDQGQAYRHQAFDEDYGRMAARSVKEGALIVGDWMPATVLWYTQTIEGLMPDAQVTVADPLDSLWQGPVEDALVAGRPVYLARPVMGAGDRFALSSAGPLVQILDQRRFSVPVLSNPVAPGTEPAAATEVEIAFLGSDVLSGAGAEPVIKGGDTLHATLVWQARQAPQGDYGVHVRWVDASGHVWLEEQNRHPVGGTYPTSRWQEGEVVADYYALDLPAHLGAGEYRLQAALALRGETDLDWTTVATLELEAAPGGMPPLGTQVRRRFGSGRVLTGYDAPPEWVPGETATLALQWLVCGAIDRDSRGDGVRPQVWLVNREGAARAVEPVTIALVGRAQSVEWVRFAVDDDLVSVELRGDAPFGLGVDRFRLPVRVAGAPPGANFDNKLRLRSYAYQADTYRPGETVQLTLEWEATRAMDEAYKVFVHVLGANGLPIAQQDNEPLNGTYPTSRWQRGERVSDPYAIALPANLPPGEYAVEVGLYRISDLTRLPVLGAEQQVVDDKLFLTPLVVQ